MNIYKFILIACYYYSLYSVDEYNVKYKMYYLCIYVYFVDDMIYFYFIITYLILFLLDTELERYLLLKCHINVVI